MFQSYTYDKFLGYDDKTNQYHYEHTIVDDDFVAVAVVAGIGGVVTVIEEYNRRNLPVAPNLFLCFCFIAKKYGYSMQKVIAWNMQYNKHYPQYEQEINKLLLLL